MSDNNAQGWDPAGEEFTFDAQRKMFDGFGQEAPYYDPTQG